MTDAEDEDKGKRGPSQGQLLRALIVDEFELGRSTDGRVYGVWKKRPTRAVMHAPNNSPMMRLAARRFEKRHNKWPNATAVAEASSWVFAYTDDAPALPVATRSHWEPSLNRLWLDVCDDPDTVIELDAKGVRKAGPPTPCPRFRRSSTAAPLPWTGAPGKASDLDALWKLVPVAAHDRSVVLALLITAWQAGVSQPVVFVTGPEDSGKTTTARFLLSLVDPISVPRGRSLPRDEREWKSAASASRVILVDNLSTLNAESSDMLCRVSTGGEASSRMLYTDDAAHVTSLAIPIWLTSIDAGALRGDFASRLIPIELKSIDPAQRLAESTLIRRQDAARSTIVRGLLWLTSEVLRVRDTLPHKPLTHRMGDFVLTLRAVDYLLGMRGEDRLAVDVRDLAADVVDASPLACAVLALFEKSAHSGRLLALPDGRTVLDELTTGDLLRLLDVVPRGAAVLSSRELRVRGGDDRSWPRTPKVLSAALQRIEPALAKAHGIAVHRRRSNGVRYVRMTRALQLVDGRDEVDRHAG